MFFLRRLFLKDRAGKFREKMAGNPAQAQSFSGKACDRARAPPHTPEHLQGALKSELLRCSGMLHSPIHVLATPNIYGC